MYSCDDVAESWTALALQKHLLSSMLKTVIFVETFLGFFDEYKVQNDRIYLN